MYSRRNKGGKADQPACSAKQKAMDLLLYRTRTEKELTDKLLERGYSEEETDEAIEYVRSFGYLNDENYAEYYVSSRGVQKGRAAIKRELRQKGVDEEIIENALYELPDEGETIMTMLIKKAGEPHVLEEKEFRRYYGFFLRHGFSQGAVIKALKEYQKDPEAAC